MRVLPRALLPQTIAWQIIAFVALCLMLGNAITFVIVSYEFRNEQRSQSPESAAAEITTFASLLGAAATQSDYFKLLAQGAAIGIAVQEVPEAQLQAQPSERKSRPGLVTALAERRAAEKGVTVLSGYQLPQSDPNAVLFRLPNQRVVAFSLPPTASRRPLFGGPALLTASIAAAFVLVLCTYVLWSITSPLATFAGAAEAFGRSLKDGPPLRERGPNEIAKLARVLNIMRSRIASLVQERTSMLVAIGHELRTPLTRIVLQAERLPATPARQTMLNDLTSMGELLSNMLSYLRSDTATEIRQNVDLPSLVQTVCSTFADRGRPISYEGRDHLVYSCRPNRLTRALSSIFENSLEYNSECSVTLDVLPSGDVYIVACPPEAKGLISQCHTEALGKPSLSLSLAKDVIESHGGTVEFGIVPPQGLCARIKLSAQPCSVRELPTITA